MKQQNEILIGFVCSRSKSQYTVIAEGKTILCHQKMSLRSASDRSFKRKKKGNGVARHHKLSMSNDEIAVGDQVELVEKSDGSGEIINRLPRRNKINRRAASAMPDSHAREQVIVTNVDLLLPVISAANPAPRWGLLDRYLVLAESMDIPAAVCISKIDLLQENSEDWQDIQTQIGWYRKIGYPVVLLSSKNGDGFSELRSLMDGNVCVLLGKSGAGKTSILNCLMPGLALKVNEINITSGKGRHTTSHVEIYPTEGGGGLIDTPGSREFGLWDLPSEMLDEYFPEMHPYLGQCKFGMGCSHLEEPGCAVREAVTRGNISPYRYRSYTKLFYERE